MPVGTTTRHSQLERPSSVLLEARGISLVTTGGRRLVRALDLTLEHEHVALVGRNGVGKSSLLSVLAQRESAQRGRVRAHADVVLVEQRLAPDDELDVTTLFERPAAELASDLELARALRDAGLPPMGELLDAVALSRGERRKLDLLAARERRPALLLLDEPSLDLDVLGIDWLTSWLAEWPGGLLVASHSRELLSRFDHFFVMAESGCRYFRGSFEALERDLDRLHDDGQKKFRQRLEVLAERERHDATVRRRRRRKKNLGRLHEEGRAPSRAQLHGKRGYAETSQGKAKKIREERITGERDRARAARRALSVRLPLELVLPELPADDASDLICLEQASVGHGRVLLCGIDLHLGRDRLGVIGPNGAGKSTLLRVMSGAARPLAGRVVTQRSRVGCVEQGATEWLRDDTLADWLTVHGALPSAASLVALLAAHKFPLALAQRELATLSAGERVRAALIALLQRQPTPELLIVDEPTSSLDFVGAAALVAGLRAWRGGLVVASHDRAFLRAIGITRYLVLDGRGHHHLVTASEAGDA